MARINLLDTRTTNFGDLIANGKIYRVPLFQRDYSWTEENWEDLWQDILHLYNNPEASHYMGAIVLQNSQDSDKEFIIIDGQQRLVTLSIIVIAAINKIQKLVEREEEVKDNKERQDILKRKFLGDKNASSLRYSSKLFLNENNDDFYQSNLINFRKPRYIRSLTKSDQLLWQAFAYFDKHLENLEDVVNSGENLANFLEDIIAQRLLFIQINVEDEFNAYTVFETLNARGIELSSTDLLKNYLFSLFQGPDDLKQAQRHWKIIIKTVRLEKFPEFLRYYLSIQHSRVRSQKLFKTVRDSVKDGQQAFDLLERLEYYSSLFIALGNSHDEFWRDTPENQPYIQELELFRVKQAYPIFLIAHDKFSPEDFTRLLKLICVISFRYTVISKLNPNELEVAYNKVAIAINNETITNPRQVFDHLFPVYVADKKFQQDFALLSISTKGQQQKKLAKYILRKLEKDVSGKDVNEESFSIEHILPESPSNQWRQNFSDFHSEEMTYRLGNLTPLEPPLNRQVGNSIYSEKLTTYQQSVYQLTKDIQNIAAEAWTPDTIATRQTDLAKKAIQVWQSDFS